MTKAAGLRYWLAVNGYSFTEERLVWDKNYLYPVLRVTGGGTPQALTERQALTGVALENDPLYREYLTQQADKLRRTAEGLRRSAKPDAEAAGMTFKPLPQLLANSEVVFTCLNKNVLLLGENEFAQLGAGKVLFNTSIGPGFDSAALEKWLDLPGTRFFCDTRAAAGPVAENFFARENVRCANVSAGRTKQAFVLLSKKVLDNLRTALGE